jgi:hypothetical protein
LKVGAPASKALGEIAKSNASLASRFGIKNSKGVDLITNMSKRNTFGSTIASQAPTLGI